MALEHVIQFYTNLFCRIGGENVAWFNGACGLQQELSSQLYTWFYVATRDIKISEARDTTISWHFKVEFPTIY